MTGLTTSEQVKRYAPDGDFSGAIWMTEDPVGRYVRHSDYVALSAKLEASEARERALLQSNDAERKVLVENASLRYRLKAAEAERDAALGLQQTDHEQPRCAECDCENGGADCNWIASGQGGAA